MKIYEDFLKSIAEILKNYTFKRSGDKFYKLVNKRKCTIEFQKSSSSHVDYIKFTMNIYIEVPLNDTHQNTNSNRGHFQKCLLGDRIGFLLPTKKDVWWLITPDKPVGNIVTEIYHTIVNIVVPLFEKYTKDEQLVALCLEESNTSWFIDQYNKYRFSVLFFNTIDSKYFPEAIDNLLHYSLTNNLMDETKEFLKENNIPHK